ncbi:MAG TPA: peptidoglycan DD-metalloendopeptidase family protein [Acidimicrobiales bacterium]
MAAAAVLTTAPLAAAPAVAGPPGATVPVRPGWWQPGETVHVPPVDAPVADPFRPPAGPYGAGNRGLEYATAPGSTVRASAPGTVTFAGAVAGALHVTVLHDGGVRTSYSFLASLDVVAGQRVRQGDPVGTSGERLHFGARIGDAYFDPATLFAGPLTEVELLPLDIPAPTRVRGEAGALAALTGTLDSLPLPGVDDALAWLRARGRAGPSYAGRTDPLGQGVDIARDLAAGLMAGDRCSSGPAPAQPVAGQHRTVVMVGGLGSSSEAAAIDDLPVAGLGYDRDRVVRFSYAGGRTPATGARFAAIPARAYRPADTQGDVVVAGSRLADLVEQVVRAEPEAVVDIAAHSLGGVVARVALVELQRRGFDFGRLGVVVTLASPHRGADAASVALAANARLAGHLAAGAAVPAIGTALDPDAVVVTQLAEHSPLVSDLAATGVPPGVRLVSIAARGDLVVAAPRTRVAGATNVTVPGAGLGAHSALVGSAAARDEVARSLAGQPPGCEPWHDVLADVATGHAVSLVEDQVGGLVARGW